MTDIHEGLLIRLGTIYTLWYGVQYSIKGISGSLLYTTHHLDRRMPGNKALQVNRTCLLYFSSL